MATEKRLIDANALLEEIERIHKKHYAKSREQYIQDFFRATHKRIMNAPTVDAVDAEKYNDLREAFVDFVCSGIQNPAPYCKNKNGMCVNGFGWCLHDSGNCQGFNPDGTKMDGERKDDG